MCIYAGVLVLVVIIGIIYIELTTCRHMLVTEGYYDGIWYERCIYCGARVKIEP